MTKKELYYLPASDLLKHIQNEKERLIKEKIIKKSKPFTPITEDLKPYTLPIGWEWVRLGDIIDYQHGYAFKSKDYAEEGYPIIRMGNLVGGNSVVFSSKNTIYYSENGSEKIISQYQVKKNDLLMCLTDMSPNREFLGNVAIYSENFISLLNQRVLKINFIKNCVRVKLGQYILNSPIIRKQLITKGSGSVQSNLSTDAVLNVKFPLPPLYIQDQIVQKLEQLSKTKEDLLSHAESQLNYTKKMRESLLQEAMRGELVPQDENDEPVSVLLEKIKAEKERLIKEKVIKKSKPLPPVTEEEKPYELPDKWEWVRLGDVVDFLGGYAFKSNTYVKKSKYQVIRIGNVKNFNLMLNSNPIYVSQHIARENDRYKLYKNDILVTMTGTLGKRDYFFTTLINDNDVEYRELYLNQRVGCLRTYYDVTAKLLNYFLKTNLILNQVFLTETGTANQGNIGANAIKELVIPLPPLSEQERIVAKLDQLMAHCDQLEDRAEEMKQSTIKLFEAGLKEAFMPE